MTGGRADGDDRPVQVIKLAWVGTRTDAPDATVAFFRDVLGLPVDLEQPEFWMLKLPDGSKLEVFGSRSELNQHFTTGPVAGFLDDDAEHSVSFAAGALHTD